MNQIVKENDADVLQVFERYIVPEINQDSALSGWDLEMICSNFTGKDNKNETICR